MLCDMGLSSEHIVLTMVVETSKYIQSIDWIDS